MINIKNNEHLYDFYHEQIEHYKQLINLPYEENKEKFVLFGGIKDPITKDRAKFHYRFWKDTIIAIIDERDNLREQNSELKKQLKELKKDK